MWKDEPGILLLFEIFDLCSPSSLSGNVLKPRWVILGNEGLTLLGNQEHRYLTDYLMDSLSLLNGTSGRGGWLNCQLRRKQCTMNQTGSVSLCGDLGSGPWPLSFVECEFPG